MKLHPEQTGEMRITSRGPGWIAIGEARYEGSVWLSNSDCRLCSPPLSTLDELTEAIVDEVIQAQPEVVLFGSGEKFALAPAALRTRLLNAGIGAESMDTAAACRTFNILVAEGRHVIALLTHG